MSNIIQIFCEDINHYGVIAKLLDKRQKGKADVRIVQTGGVRGARAFKEGYNKRTGVQSVADIFFRDRDFDFPPSHEVILYEMENEKHTYVSHRTTIENYLFDADLFLTYTSKHHPSSFKTSDDVISLFTESAKQIGAYEAVRHTLGFFRKNYSFRTTWTKGSGNLPSNLDERECVSKGFTLIDDVRQSLCPIDKNVFTEKFDEFYNSFNDNFYENQLYWVWFNAKDIEKAIRTQLPDNFSFDAYHNFAIKNLNFTEKYNDLSKMLEVIERY